MVWREGKSVKVLHYSALFQSREPGFWFGEFSERRIKNDSIWRFSPVSRDFGLASIEIDDPLHLTLQFQSREPGFWFGETISIGSSSDC